MPQIPKLSPKEKRQAERLIFRIQFLSRQFTRLSDVDRFFYRQHLRSLLIILGTDRKNITPYLRKESLDIVNGWKPFKIRRLRKLINGRRRQ